MGRLTVRLPEALHQQLEILARDEGVSLNQYLVYALTRQATLDAFRKPELNTQPQHLMKPLNPADPSTSNDQGKTEEIRHLHGGGLPPPTGK